MCETQAVSNPWRYALLSIYGSPDPILLTNGVIMKKEEEIQWSGYARLSIVCSHSLCS